MGNKEAIAVNQDIAREVQGRRLLKLPIHGNSSWHVQLWAKELTPSQGWGISRDLAVAILNSADIPVPFACTWSKLGLGDASAVLVRDIWEHRNLGPQPNL